MKSLDINELNFSIKPRRIQIQEFYTLYSLTAASLYCYAQSEQLMKKKQYAWGIVTYYYSLVYVARFFSYLALKKYPTMHKEIKRLFSGENLTLKNTYEVWSNDKDFKVLKYFNFNDLLQRLRNYGIRGDEIIFLGKSLDILCDLRNDCNYQGFIMGNQVNHKIITPLIEKAHYSKRIYFKKYVILMLNTLVKYSMQDKEFQAFLLDKNENFQYAFNSLLELLKEQKFPIGVIREIEFLIKIYVLNKIKDAPDFISNNFYESITPNNFSEKGDKFDNFLSHFRNFQSLLLEFENKFKC